MEWKVLKLDKTVESTFESELDPENLLVELSGSVDADGRELGYFFYDSGLFDALITSASLAESASFDYLRILANETHYQMFLTENS